MKTLSFIGASSVMALATVSCAEPILQFDVNSFRVTASGTGGGFGGLTHTGTIDFSVIQNTTVLNGMFSNVSGSWANMGFNGSLSNFTGSISLVNGQVTGGTITLAVNGGSDTYTTNISAAGHVENYVGGGFKIEGLTSGGTLSDAQFGNVDVSPWFNQALLGSFLQFNWNPDALGNGSGDMDIFVNIVPLPPAAWAGLATLGGVVLIRKARRR